MKKQYIGWYGGDYDKAGFYDTKKDAERGHVGGEYLHEVLSDFDGKKIKITVEILEE